MKSDLASRMIVNVLGIPSVIALVYFGRVYFALFILIVCLLGLKEFYQILSAKSISPQIWPGFIVSVPIAYFYYYGFNSTFFSLTWHSIILLFVLITLMIELFRNKENPTGNITSTLGGILYVPVLLASLIGIRQIDILDYQFGFRLTISLFISIWVCDSIAYFFGLKWGKKKIFPRVSPKKSIVGSVSGLVSSIVVYIIMFKTGLLSSNSNMYSFNIYDILALGVISGGFSQIGDFVESLIKRDVGVKDTSSFLGGHGGILDRFDSLLFAAPLTYLYLTIFMN